MKRTLEVINSLEEAGIIGGYALGGATALLFYAEPALTFDVDIFVLLPEARATGGLIDLNPLYAALERQGYAAEKEHVIIEGIPVQFIPVYNALVEEAVRQASVTRYDGVPVHVLTMEYLFAIMIDTNRPKDRERIRKLLEEVRFDLELLNTILDRHALRQKWENYIGKR